MFSKHRCGRGGEVFSEPRNVYTVNVLNLGIFGARIRLWYMREGAPCRDGPRRHLPAGALRQAGVLPRYAS